jgi:hypothetical protein
MVKDPFSDEAADEFLSGGGVAAKWPKVGFIVTGTVVDWSMSQQTDYDTGEPLFWDGKKKSTDDGNGRRRPVMQLIINIQGKPTGETWEGLDNERVELPDDDGMRTLYVKGGLQNALRLALNGAKLEAGAQVSIKREKDGPKTNPKFRAPYRYSATWTPASQNADAATDALNDDGDESPFS